MLSPASANIRRLCDQPARGSGESGPKALLRGVRGRLAGDLHAVEAPPRVAHDLAATRVFHGDALPPVLLPTPLAVLSGGSVEGAKARQALLAEGLPADFALHGDGGAAR